MRWIHQGKISVLPSANVGVTVSRVFFFPSTSSGGLMGGNDVTI